MPLLLLPPLLLGVCGWHPRPKQPGAPLLVLARRLVQESGLLVARLLVLLARRWDNLHDDAFVRNVATFSVPAFPIVGQA
jgi:hypothetical protein